MHIAVSIVSSPVSSPLQIGALPDHSPLNKQERVSLPTRKKPGLQEYVAVEPGEVPVRLTWPYCGSGRGSQSMAVRVCVCVYVCV